jgi:iron complex transport system substrate-binding protein
MKTFKILLFLIVLISCKDESKPSFSNIEDFKQLDLKYAEGFSVINYKLYKVLTILKPWPNIIWLK